MRFLALTPLLMLLMLGLVACGDDPHATGTGGNLLDTTLRERTPEVGLGVGQVGSLDNPERENWQKPQMVISLLGDLSDKTVADIGAGTGYFSFRIAEKAEKVIAIDIDTLLLGYIGHRLAERRRGENLNLEPRLTTPDSPGLKEAEADLVLFVNTYHLLEDRTAYFQKVAPTLKPGGSVVIIDFKQGLMPVGPPPAARISPSQAINELSAAGFSPTKLDTTSLDYQYILTCSPSGSR